MAKQKETTNLQTNDKEVRVSYMLDKKLLEKIKAMAYWNRSTQKEILTTALQETIVKYEKENGGIKPIPKK